MNKPVEKKEPEKVANGNGNGKQAWWLYILDRFGVPTFLLIVGGYWLATCVAQPLVRAHVNFLDEQISLSVQQSEALKQQVALSGQQAKAMDKATATLAKQAETLEEVRSFMGNVSVTHALQVELLKDLRKKDVAPNGSGNGG